jgi:hypothetical protein
MKLAQYEVLGMVQKTSPSRQGRKTLGSLPSYAASRAQADIDRPVRDGSLLNAIPSTSCWATFIVSLRD